VSSRIGLGGALASGLLFGAGLVVSGMTQPVKILGFLDVFGAWDASLAFVMIGAIGVHAVLFRLIVRRKAPVAAPRFELPVTRRIDAPLVLGSALFGIGWGLSGYCPGPSIVALASGGTEVLVFVAALLVGSFLGARFLDARAEDPKSLSALRP